MKMVRAQAKTKHLRRRQLDSKLKRLERDALLPPKRGWVRAIRTALGMNSRQLAERMDISTGHLAHIESAEAAGSINMETLRRTADALNCDLVYALVPRAGSLEKALEEQAEKVARVLVQRVATSMALEDQATDTDAQDYLIRDTVSDLTRELRKALWDTPL